MAAAIGDILAFLDDLLDPQRFDDYCVNGLQVPGPDTIDTLATGVSASAELFERAAETHAGLLLVHHGLFWGDGERVIDPLLKRRLKLLFDADIALAAYHLPLDAHPEHGNNALLAAALGAHTTQPFALHHGEPIGVLAELPGPGLTYAELLEAAAKATGGSPPPFGFEAPNARNATTIAVVTGAGADYLSEAAAQGAQALVTGEASERTMALAREHGVHLIAAGHYATETFGVRSLGELLAERFAVRHTFLDVPNPV
jgi:dinuclear metal center YbgI/SA1388 family protein